MRSYILSLCVVAVFLLSNSTAVAATYQTPRTETERQQLIITLLKEVVRLQTMLKELEAAKLRDREPYESILFTLPIETTYFVAKGELVPASGTAVRAIDAEIFAFFTDVLGEAAVSQYVAEWRVFNAADSTVDAAVESIGDTGRYVVNINRAGYADRPLVKRSFANLFVHEFSHLLFFDRPEIVDDFTAEFWTTRDLAHAEAVGEGSSYDVDLLPAYFSSNADRFVTEYATVSPEEDMAETFVAFVLNDRPAVSTVKSRKLLWFYRDPIFTAKRLELRANLQADGLL